MTKWALLFLFLTAVIRADDIAVPAGMVLVPAGEFTMGSDDGGYDERPAHRVKLSAYFIDRREVTVAEFAAFVRATNAVETIEGSWFRFSAEGCIDLLAYYENRYGITRESLDLIKAKDATEPRAMDCAALRWQAGVAALRVLLGPDAKLVDSSAATLAATPQVQTLIRDQRRLPVRCVTWRDAANYAAWADKRLPTEAEWEKAARGPEGHLYPWGSSWDATKCVAGIAAEAGPAPVGSHPEGASPYGCEDMAGNVWEWCADWYGPAAYADLDGVSDPKGPEGLANGELPPPDPAAKLFRANQQGRESNTRKVIRGGCWADGLIGQTEFNLRCPRRLWANPGYWQPDTGFRCAKDLK